MQLLERIQIIESELRQRLNPKMLTQTPLDEYLDACLPIRKHGGYQANSQRVRDLRLKMIRSYGEADLERYHRLLLLTLIRHFEADDVRSSFPCSIEQQFRKYFLGVVNDVQAQPEGYFHHDHDRFQKDFAVVRRKLVPCGAQLVEVFSGVPRSFAFKGGFQQIIGFPWFMMRKARGFRPWYEMHMDMRLMLEFTPSGWRQCYLRIAELLRRERDILGVFGASWWFDPALEDISPRLSFLFDLPRQHGAKLFRLDEDKESVHLALTNSKQRQNFHREGKYRPTRYLMVWSRNDLLGWAAHEES